MLVTWHGANSPKGGCRKRSFANTHPAANLPVEDGVKAHLLPLAILASLETFLCGAFCDHLRISSSLTCPSPAQSWHRKDRYTQLLAGLGTTGTSEMLLYGLSWSVFYCCEETP